MFGDSSVKKDALQKVHTNKLSIKRTLLVAITGIHCILADSTLEIQTKTGG